MGTGLIRQVRCSSITCTQVFEQPCTVLLINFFFIQLLFFDSIENKTQTANECNALLIFFYELTLLSTGDGP